VNSKVTKSVTTLAVPLPPIEEQTLMVAEVDGRLIVLGELEAVGSTNLQRAFRIRLRTIRS
jgi:hypothetical protein